MKYRTPLSKVRGLGPASEGAAHWWMQRLTAVALVPLTLWFGFSVAALSGADYAALVSWIRLPAVSVFLIVLIIAALYHMQLGLKVIVEDYVHVKWLNLLLIIGVDLLSMVLIVAGILSVLKIVLGAN
jgi:succinate dehydrogenase / fumarate reductase membrane anchor subunit